MPWIRGAHRHEEPAEVLHVGLARRVADGGSPFREDRRHQGVLRAGDRGLVEEDIGADELVGDEAEGPIDLDAGPQLLEGEDVRVDAPPADDIPSRRRQLDLAEAREQGAGEKDGGPDLARLLGRHVGAVHRA